jgi:mRNA interferase MazF
MATYEQFDIVLVPFPFTDTGETKRRPALIISDSTEFNTPMRRSVMVMITTAGRSPWALDIPITDLSPTGLSASSIIWMKLFTLDHHLVSRKIGSLSMGDRQAVAKVLGKLMNLIP